MKRTVIRLVAGLLSAALAIGLSACGGRRNTGYPDFPLTENNGVPSWQQGDRTDLTIDWYVDDSTFYWAGSKGSAVSDKIYKETGIKINFLTPLNDTGDMLSSILNSGDMPDLITIACNNTTRVQLQEEGYTYSLDGLSERWAPTLFDNWSEEINYLFAASDGELYGVPNLYYSLDDIAAFDAQKETIQANYSVIARKDYVEAYVAHKKAGNPAWSDVEATTPSGFIEMCKWVKETYSVPHPILTDAFLTTEDNGGVYGLAQYFSVPRESADGQLLYLEEQEGFYDTLAFLNGCYREGLIADTNFSNTKQQQAGILSRGDAFAFIGQAQNATYGGACRNFALKNTVGLETSNLYVGLVLTNENGDAPVLANLAGNGHMFTMVTRDCDRPDRVVKFIDYMTSLEGQMLTYFGVQGEHWNYDVQPGQTVTEADVTGTITQADVGKTFTFGRAQWTPDAFRLVADSQAGTTIGISTFQLLRPNKAMSKLATFSGDEMYHFSTYLVRNVKAVTYDWAHTFKFLSLNAIRDARGGDNYIEVTTKNNMCQQLWREQLANIITASSQTACRENYLRTLERAKQLGAGDVLAFDNALFQRLKEKFGMTRCWAPLTEGYTPVPVTSVFGNVSNIIEIPDFIARK